MGHGYNERTLVAGLSLTGWIKGGCRKIVGTDEKGNNVYCGEPKVEGSAYCETHQVY